jgi:hypothetical protein
LEKRVSLQQNGCLLFWFEKKKCKIVKHISVRMEEDLLTAVRAVADYPVVAPLPSISNRLSIADFQRISPTRMDYTNNFPFSLPEVAITEPPLTPERTGFWPPANQVYDLRTLYLDRILLPDKRVC